MHTRRKCLQKLAKPQCSAMWQMVLVTTMQMGTITVDIPVNKIHKQTQALGLTLRVATAILIRLSMTRVKRKSSTVRAVMT